jgi:hypothetical protein
MFFKKQKMFMSAISSSRAFGAAYCKTMSAFRRRNGVGEKFLRISSNRSSEKLDSCRIYEFYAFVRLFLPLGASKFFWKLRKTISLENLVNSGKMTLGNRYEPWI